MELFELFEMDLERIMSDTSRGVCLFGTVPPRISVSSSKVEDMADKFAAGVKDLDVDAIAVYDIQVRPQEKYIYVLTLLHRTNRDAVVTILGHFPSPLVMIRKCLPIF